MIWEKKLGFPNCIICQHQKAISNVSEVSCRERLIFLISNFPFTYLEPKQEKIHLPFWEKYTLPTDSSKLDLMVNFLRKCLFLEIGQLFSFSSPLCLPSFSHLYAYYYRNCIINVCVNSTFLPQYVFVFIFICNLVVVVET